ncbi:hypothetical protein [Methylobacterium sp. J-090]|uniref:hypothetical protein n=1 Tax=Methylobacterium sp. J-090 TaxID=2836666 RepID=UPI001FBBA71B|nr:hypothetical protein [Methylobacterium sp. J-090]MCJ2082594.1 hypothetical protein [Methylobacterium sp. J-090]
MRPRGFGALLLALAATPGPALGQDRDVPPPRGPDRTLTLGGDGWVLERFGRDLAVLRTGATPPSGPAGLLVLSCEGGERRWRLSLPQRLLPEGDSSTTGQLLARPSGSAGRSPRATIGPVQIADGRVLTLTEGRAAAGAFVPAFVRLLRAGPSRIDLLLRRAGPGRPPVLFGSTIPAIVFAPVVGRSDIVAFDDFLATCVAAPR